MFMFRKKEKMNLTTPNLQKEAKKFQKAVQEVNKNYKPAQIDVSLLNGVATKFNVDAAVMAEAFEVYLKNNALGNIRTLKASNDYTVMDLEKAALSYGFELADLNVTFFSEE